MSGSVPNRLGLNHLRQHASDLVDELEFSSLAILEIERGVPVGRLVLGDSARSAIAVHQFCGGHSFGKRCQVLALFKSLSDNFAPNDMSPSKITG